MMKIGSLYKKYKDIVWYLFFGVCTTVVNIGVYWIMAHLFQMSVMFSTLIAWTLAVFFAYVTNRKLVFHSEADGKREVLKEMTAFFSCRLATGLVDWLCMFVFVNVLDWNDMFVKAFANILVIILNYVASKLVIFKKARPVTGEEHKKINYDFWIGLIIIALACIIFFTDGLNAINYQLIEYDEGYNATVAANVARYGQYRVSYPAPAIFYNKITTGETVILPTALLYKLFGINAITSSIVSVIYGTLCIFLLWLLLCVCLESTRGKSYTIAAGLTVLLVLSENIYESISRNLIGEIAALFFLLVSYYAFYGYLKKNNVRNMIVSGAMLAFSFLTKSSMIFFVVSCFGIVMIETILSKTIEKKHAICYYAGFAVGFAALDWYKLTQLGGIRRYIQWWADEWQNMLSQSSGIDVAYSITEKINYLPSIFPGYNKYFCLLLLILPVMAYGLHVGKRILCRGKNFDAGMLTMAISGVGGASLIVYFILLGGKGLVYARRQTVNELLVRFFAIYLLGIAVKKIYHVIAEKHAWHIKRAVISVVSISITCLIISWLFPVRHIREKAVSYVKKESDNSYGVQLMDEFLNEIENLESDAVLYCAGWWQEPNVTLYLDKDMHDIYDVIDGNEELAADSYLIVGNYIDGINTIDIENELNAKLIREDTSEVDYVKYPSLFDKRDFELFAIYRIDIGAKGI